MEPMFDMQRPDVERGSVHAALRADRFLLIRKDCDHFYPLLRNEGGFAEHSAVAYHTVEWAEVREGGEWVGTMEWKTYYLRNGDVVMLAVVPDEGVWLASNSVAGFRVVEQAAVDV